MEDVAFLRARLASFRRGGIPTEDLYGFIHDLGHAGLSEAASDVAGLLRHPSDQIRAIAVRVLAFHWNLKEYKHEFIRLLLTDRDDWVRSFSAAGLGFVLRGSRDAQSVRVLIGTLRDSSELPLIREAAYDAIRNIWIPGGVGAEEALQEIRQELESAKVEAQDWEKARSSSREQMQTHVWLWKQEWEMKVDWDLIRRIELEVGDKARDEPQTE